MNINKNDIHISEDDFNDIMQHCWVGGYTKIITDSLKEVIMTAYNFGVRDTINAMQKED